MSRAKDAHYMEAVLCEGRHQMDHPHTPIFLLNEIFPAVYKEMNWAIFSSLQREVNLLPPLPSSRWQVTL